MMTKDPCDAAMRLDHHDVELRCELERPHRDHQVLLRNYAFAGSVTIMTWHEGDRRCFHGEWPGDCEVVDCTLPLGHKGDHLVAVCDHRWLLLDPNEEDRANGTTHRCCAPSGHREDHRCACGARPGDDP
jgi:hypothetical protein